MAESSNRYRAPPGEATVTQTSLGLFKREAEWWNWISNPVWSLRLDVSKSTMITDHALVLLSCVVEAVGFLSMGRSRIRGSERDWMGESVSRFDF